MLWDAMLLEETLRKLEGLEKEGSLENVVEIGDVQPSLCRIELVRNTSLWRAVIVWVSIKMRNPKRVLISAHFPTIKAPWEDFNVPLHELEQLIRRFSDH